MSNRPRLLSSLFAFIPVLAMVAAVHPAAAQQQQTASQFIAGVEASIGSLTASLTPGQQPIVIGAQEFFAHGSLLDYFAPGAAFPQSVLLEYADGLKAAGVQRVEFNPGVTSIDDPVAVGNLDALVRHIRQLGMQLAINPEYTNSAGVGEFPVGAFQDFVNMAITTYPALAARYQPDNFVIVHEPTTMAARMKIATAPSDWVNFIQQVEPLIKKASPHTRVGAGDCVGCNEDSFFSAFAPIQTCTATNISSGCLDFMTADIYSTNFSQVQEWAQLAHENNKGMYIEETWAPTFLPNPLPPGIQSSPGGQESFALLGSANSVFEQLDQDWLSAMAMFVSSDGMESLTPFTTETFFLYVSGTSPQDGNAVSPTYIQQVAAAIEQGQPLTATDTSYAADAQKYGIKIATSVSNASYATSPNTSNPNSIGSTVSPDMLVSAFGVDLADQTIPVSAFPTSLGGTTATLVDSMNVSFAVQIYSVAAPPGSQVNYLVPSNVAYGPATLTVTSGDGTVSTGIVLVAPVAPGLYTAPANGQGAASAIAVCVGTCSGWTTSLGNGQFEQPTFPQVCTLQNCPPVPITWGANDQLVIELYGTGIRHRAAQSDVTASIGSTSLQVQYAGAQPTDTGLDQVNVAIPQSLNGAGQVGLSLAVQYTDPVTNLGYVSPSNTVTFCLQSSACSN